MMRDENGPAVPEFARRATLSWCKHNPVRAFVPVLTAMPAAGIPLGDVLADSGYAHRDADAWAVPLRAAGTQLVQDLHPHDRGPPRAPTPARSSPTGTCTARPRPPLPELGPPAMPPRTKLPRTTPAPPNWPATSPAGSAATTATGTTGFSARPPWARSAARCGPPR